MRSMAVAPRLDDGTGSANTSDAQGDSSPKGLGDEELFRVSQHTSFQGCGPKFAPLPLFHQNLFHVFIPAPRKNRRRTIE